MARTSLSRRRTFSAAAFCLSSRAFLSSASRARLASSSARRCSCINQWLVVSCCLLWTRGPVTKRNGTRQHLL